MSSTNVCGTPAPPPVCVQGGCATLRGPARISAALRRISRGEMVLSTPRGRIHYGWIVVAVTFVTLLAAAGIRSAPGVLMIPLEREFGWTRATVSFAVSINLFLYGLSGPFIAGLMDRLGIRRVMVTSLALVATAVALTTVMTTSWQLALLWGVVVGLGTGTMASVLGAMVANRWFTERRGLVLGLLTASSATGQLVFLPLLASMVVRLGWRSAVLLVAGVALVVLPLVAVLMRDQPRDIGLRPFGPPANAPATPRPSRAAVAAPVIGRARLLRRVSPARGRAGRLRWRPVTRRAR